MTNTPMQRSEPHDSSVAGRLNWLRAAVLGANDGIVSTAATVVGVAGVTNAVAPILVAGTAAVVGGSVSMALGEYVSVSSQKDSQEALIEKERRELAEDPDGELEELAGLYEQKGMTPGTARQVAVELTQHDALAAHLSAELNIDELEVVNPWHAAFASAAAFAAGAVLPLLAILLPPAELRIPITFVAVLVALAITGAISAKVGGSSRRRATIRLVIGGALAMAFTYLVGSLLGTTGIA
ncbi:VIT1/CCC1 transporter family protein [Arthrobacter sp. TMS2-4]